MVEAREDNAGSSNNELNKLEVAGNVISRSIHRIVAY